MENAPFGLNTDEIAYFKKVCKSVRFFAQVREMTFPDWQSGAVAEPDWGVGMQVFGRGFFDIGSFVPRSRVLLFFSLVCFSNSKLIQSANPRDQASPQASAGTGGGLPGNFQSILSRNFFIAIRTRLKLYSGSTGSHKISSGKICSEIMINTLLEKGEFF